MDHCMLRSKWVEETTIIPAPDIHDNIFAYTMTMTDGMIMNKTVNK